MIALDLHGRILMILLVCCGLVGCGLHVPDIKEAWDADKPEDSNGPRIPGAGQIEFEIKKHVFCELGDAVKYVNSTFHASSGPSPDKLARLPALIPSDWAAQVALSLQVDESSALSPGVTLNTVLPNVVKTFGPGSSVTTSQARNVGFGGTLSSTATRIDKFNPTWTIGYLMRANTPTSICHKENDPFTKDLGWAPDTSSPFIIDGNLGIQDWLTGAMMTDLFIPSQTVPALANGGVGGGGGAGGGGGGGAHVDTISYEVKFIIVSNGNVTPTWKLVNVSANTTGTLFAAGRTRTHDLIITIGPADQQTLLAHLSSQIGQAVSGGNSTLLVPP
jgi:hypothetical protein